MVNRDALEASPLRLTSVPAMSPMEGYVNVDMRELPGIDVVATVDDLPFEPGTLDEIFSSHTLEHFPQEVLRRQLLPVLGDAAASRAGRSRPSRLTWRR